MLDRKIEGRCRGGAKDGKGFAGVTSAANETSAAAHHVLEAASALRHQAEMIKSDVGQFLSAVKEG